MRDRMVRIVAWIGVYETMNVGAGRQRKINAFCCSSFLTFRGGGAYCGLLQ